MERLFLKPFSIRHKVTHECYSLYERWSTLNPLIKHSIDIPLYAVETRVSRFIEDQLCYDLDNENGLDMMHQEFDDVMD